MPGSVLLSLRFEIDMASITNPKRCATQAMNTYIERFILLQAVASEAEENIFPACRGRDGGQEKGQQKRIHGVVSEGA